MTTNKKITFNFLDSYFLESNNQINKEYLNNMIKYDYIDNFEPLYKLVKDSSIKPLTATREAIFTALNNEIKFTDYKGFYITSYQLKQWLELHNETWNIFQPVYDYIMEYRKEL
jgi:hypothetical protein